MYPKHFLFISMILLVVLLWGTSLCLAGNVTGDKDIIDAAHKYVVANSAPGIKYKLKVAKRVENWAVVDIIPLRKDLDQALVILERVDGKWIGRELTTDTSVLEEYPELSK
jgi:hypothetical protein